MKRRVSVGRLTFNIINCIVLTVLSLLCIFPMVNVLALSFSDKANVSAGLVTFWPRGFTLFSYKYLLQRDAFWRAFFVSMARLILGTAINLFMIVLTAYPLAKESSKLRFRTFYAWFFFITLLVNGGILIFTKVLARDILTE